MWYRVLEVLFGFIWLLLFISVSVFIVEAADIPYEDYSMTLITCKNNSEEHPVRAKKIDVFSGDEPTLEEASNIAKNFCGSKLTTADLEILVRNGIVSIDDTYELSGFVMDTRKDYVKIIWQEIVALLVIGFTVEAARRLSYYIFLGRFVPEK